jgi:cell division transport system permease protein
MTGLLRACGFAFRTAVTDVARRPLSSLLAIAAMAVAVFVLAAFMLMSRGARAVYAQIASQSAIEIFLRQDAKPAAVDDLAGQLSRAPEVRRVERITPEQAIAELGRLYPDLSDVGALLGGNPLPASIRVVPKVGDPDALSGLMRLARTHPAVLSVRYDREWLTSLARAGDALRAFAIGGAVLLVLAGLVTIGSVVRLTLDEKLDEVRLLRLVGAPISFVLAPVLFAGALLGAAGAVAALVTIGLGRSALLGWATGTPLDAFLVAALDSGPPVGLALVLLFLAALAGAVSAGLGAGRAALR